MSCEKNGRRCSNAAKINGISGHISRYLNVIGSLGTYRDLNNVEDVPERIAQITATFFGLKGLVEGHPRLVGVLGILIGCLYQRAAAGQQPPVRGGLLPGQ